MRAVPQTRLDLDNVDKIKEAYHIDTPAYHYAFFHNIYYAKLYAGQSGIGLRTRPAGFCEAVAKFGCADPTTGQRLRVLSSMITENVRVIG